MTSVPTASVPYGRPSRRRADLALVFLGGTLGTGIRMLVSALVPTGPLPVAILLVNLVGAFLIGMLLEGLARRTDDAAGRRWRLLLGTGFLGGLTTYSALATDTVLITTGDYPGVAGDSGAAIAYAAGSLLGGVAASAAGVWVGARLGRHGGPERDTSADAGALS